MSSVISLDVVKMIKSVPPINPFVTVKRSGTCVDSKKKYAVINKTPAITLNIRVLGNLKKRKIDGTDV